MSKEKVFKLPKSASNAAATFKGTNSRVGKTYRKCNPNQLCDEVYVCNTISECKICKKIKS